MINKTGLTKTARILNVGAGSSTLIDELLNLEYSNVLATDISKVSLDNLKARLGNESRRVEWIVDNLTKPTLLNDIQPVAFWIDRAVLHFLSEPDDQTAYFNLLKEKVSKGGFCAKYALTVLNECEVSNDELEEVKAIAMTVNATKIKIQLMDAEKELSNKSK